MLRGLTFIHRTPQALHRVLGPLGPARHTGVTLVPQWLQCCPGAAGAMLLKAPFKEPLAPRLRLRFPITGLGRCVLCSTIPEASPRTGGPSDEAEIPPAPEPPTESSRKEDTCIGTSSPGTDARRSELRGCRTMPSSSSSREGACHARLTALA